jgi:serine/threonine-protein kinase
MRPPRALLGSAGAPVRLTEFTDALCGHCADLHDTLKQLGRTLPAGAFALEVRHFPLDPACNPELAGESNAPVRCLAARSVICLEGRPDAFDYAGRIYDYQATLDDEKVYELAEALLSKNDLVSCVNDPATDAKLRDDIAWAMEHDLHGTPLVLLNGRQVAAFGPLLYALILTRGDAEHDVFSGLPEPDTGDPHEGHGH